MKNRKREETTKKTKRQTSEAKKSESEKGSCGSRGETKQKRSRNEAETKQKRSRNGGDEKAKRSGRSEPGGFREEVQREGMERRYGEKGQSRDSERRRGSQIRRAGDAERGCRGRQRGKEPGGSEPLRRPEPAGNNTQDDGDSFQR